jgi:hypothetical protein
MRLLTSIALVVVAGGGCVTTETDSSLLVSNRSDFEIHELYITPVGASTWGDNLLGHDILVPGDQMELGLSCGTYDAMIIDETGAVCELDSVDLCFDDADWIIRNSTCSIFEERAAAKAATTTGTPGTTATPK